MKLYIADMCTFPLRVETKTDAYSIIKDSAALDRYIKEFGNVSVVFDSEWNVWRVPDFADAIKKYSDAKQIDCQRWGCE